MSSINFENLILEYPEITESIEQIEAVANRKKSALIPEFTIERFFDRFSLPASVVSAKLLGRLQELGVLNKIIRVESKYGGGIQDFGSLLEIPKKLHDFRIDEDVVVEPTDIKVLYQLLSQELESNSDE